MDKAEHKEREHFFSQAKLQAAITMVSRILGLIRDVGITRLGANASTDAFGMAFQIPNLFRRLFGEGALASAFVPVFTDVNEKEGFEKASKLLANALALLAVFLSGLMLVGEIGFFIFSLFPGPADRQLFSILALIMFPYMFTVCLLALCSAALNSRGHFAYPAAAPIVFNIFGIVAAYFIAPFIADLSSKLVIIAFSVVIAGVVQLALVLWLLNSSGFEIRPKISPREPGIKPILILLGPMLLGLGFLQFSEFLQTWLAWNLRATDESQGFKLLGYYIAYPLDEGVIVRVNAARAFYQLPLGVLAVSLGVAVFPLLSRYALRNDTVNLRQAVNRALRLSLMEGLATGTGLFLLAEPIMLAFYASGKHSRFTPADAAQAAYILKLYAVGMWAYCSYQILARSFYALKDTQTPLKISCGLVVVNFMLILSLIWIPAIGPGVFGLSTAITFAINVLILIYLLRKRLGALDGRHVFYSVLRSLAACGAMAAVVSTIRYYMAGVSAWYVLAACVPAGGITFIGAVVLMKSPEIRELLNRN